MSHFRLRYGVFRMLVQGARARGAMLDRPRLVALWWNCIWYSITEAILERSHEESPDQSGIPPPLILCGFWRSGTTYLHELLACDDALNYPGTAVCLNPALLLLPESARQKRAKELLRPMDGMPVRADSPQEDEFALMTLGLRSPYRAMIFPGLMASAISDLDPAAWTEPERRDWQAGFLKFLRRLFAGDSRRLLLKSPTHSFKVDFLAKIFPEAQFIIILRDPCEVWASNEKMWRMMFDLHAVERLSNPPVTRFIADAYRLMAVRLEQAMSVLPPHRFCFTSLESLEHDPVGTLERIYHRLNLPDFDRVKPRMVTRVRSSKPFQKSSYHLEDRYRGEVLRQIGDAHARLQALAQSSAMTTQ